jgi:nucleoid-associated protein YgaU
VVRKGSGEYAVVHGDTLSTIAQTHHVNGGWQKLYAINHDTVRDADLIYPGQHLRLG